MRNFNICVIIIANGFKLVVVIVYVVFIVVKHRIENKSRKINTLGSLSWLASYYFRLNPDPTSEHIIGIHGGKISTMVCAVYKITLT